MARLARRAEKDLNALPEALTVKAKQIIRYLDQDPHVGKKLAGPLQGKRATRLGRSHRIIYIVSEGHVIVLTISHRRDAYR
ncbi:MAG: type II toxin-antitoxin system RelE/ParE family toxin [Acidimicrobiia bacterium]|nr:type II toxin-antitoxin system RelE/ParE family toxin [Acidimicrobiia bacterium]MYC58280.1 type II toxin-antitoxin system RelE/ParE family toxin [Acidimicrobiia bacterium]MYG93944.1 type II toxin-antitoxin system RelE/ParE family toxin [Acidimicrobiia bacterium]MYI30013.1 type II toxin-antitoxin system RelE/ParE family toxin [Acidimicrobiia bacterium]